MEASKNDRLVKKFAALEDKTWFPQELLELVKDVCRLQGEVRASLAVSVDPALVCGDMEHRQGAPLLAREQFPVDAEGAEKLFRAILEVAESPAQLRTTAQLVRDKLIRGDIRPEELFRAYMLENAEPFEAWAKEAPDAPNLLPFLVYNSMEPWLEAAGEALSSAYPQNDVWQHGHCPVCGSPAFIGHLSGPEPSRNEGRDINKGGKRMHTCSYCRTTFRAKRIQCRSVLRKMPRNWTISRRKTNRGTRFMSAARAKSYIKIADFREFFGRESIPALDDLESLPLDIAAQNEDFHRVAPSEWGL